jgi:hypothetical protein
MEFYTAAPVWLDKNSLPNTTPHAKPSGSAKVSGPVITVKDAYYRGSVFSGTFLLAETPDKLKRNGKQRVKVYCLWFGHRLKRFAPSFLVDMASSTVMDNGGSVSTNLCK